MYTVHLYIKYYVLYTLYSASSNVKSNKYSIHVFQVKNYNCEFIGNFSLCVIPIPKNSYDIITFIAKNQVENFNSNSEKVINSLLYATEHYQITNFSFYVVLCTLHFGMYFKKNISVISIYDLKMCICF